MSIWRVDVTHNPVATDQVRRLPVHMEELCVFVQW